MSDAARSIEEALADTWVVVLAWNGWSDTKACLESLQPIARRGAHVLLVDNASEDGTPRLAREAAPWAEVLELDANLGFPGGNNAGIRMALSRGAQHVVLLNNDTVVDPYFVDELLRVAQANPRAGFVCSKMYFIDRPGALWFAGARLGRFTGHTPITGFGEIDRGQHDSTEEIELFNACSVLVTQAALEEVGLMDEALFLYCEEVDWTLRAQTAGLAVLFAPRSRIWHRGMASTGGLRTGNHLYYYTRNILYIFARHRPLRFWPARLIRNTAIVLVLIASVFSQRLDVGTSASGLWHGVRDYLLGRMGPRPERRGAVEP